ncbi:tetratricopeptide repeat protein [Candidatus Methylopumilus planktonicus]|uniref:tetratricopeptide repeat protein n=1 Tax=Candidatus Methylopumilus planktonicus TaxID=1581557 RepID=UPI003BEF19F0
MKFKYTILLFAWFISSSLSHASDLDSLAELIQKGRETEAIAKINRYIQKYPNDPEVKFIYGAALDHFGRTQEAEKVFLHLNRKYPNNPAIKNNLGVIYTKLSQYAKARIYFESALRLKSDYHEARSNLGYIQKLDRVYLTSK